MALSVTPVHYRCETNGWNPIWLTSSRRSTENTHALAVIINPNNPTGAVSQRAKATVGGGGWSAPAAATTW